MSSEQVYEQYRLLEDELEASGEETASESAGRPERQFQPGHGSSPRLWRSLAIFSAVLLSHAVIFFLGFKVRQYSATEGLSPYLKLGYSNLDTLWWNTEYSDGETDEAELNRLWDSTIPWETGIIALANEEAAEMGLPDSQPFPWDASRKKIYILNAHHILHCVRNIYISIHQYRTNQTQTINYAHILHCLDSLRVETMCTADDTLRYVPLNSVHGFRPGDGQKRQCRDWRQVESFVKAHDPCYQYLRPGDPEQSNLERFSFCPTGSEYLPKIRKYFGHNDDWNPPSPTGPREIE
ncbi:hypothetical protein JX265_011776 [Neoarthrinium moseri]|uniref:Uncharacterized protein n=1 Tax=Neoarthrinium moseri TaxID=1658444 RepID=A0A9Q0AJD8_9PEZI|nr:hypothetical protein JX265_011776 [Neoarthrinium moseri]